MITEFWKFYKEAQRLGIPIDTIVLFVLIGAVGFGSWKVIKYMRASKKEILDQQEQVASALIENTTHMSAMVVGLQESVGILTNMNFRLESMTKPDERVVESQAKIIYGLMMQELFDNIKENYFNVRDWIELKNMDTGLDKSINNIDERLILIFDANLKNLEDKMKNFKYNDKSISIYLNTKFRSEYAHLKDHIFGILVQRENGIRVYLEQKKDFFISDFNSWLKDI
jgi:hypothetical protein